MSSHNICFRGEIRKILVLLIKKSPFFGAVGCYVGLSGERNMREIA